MTFPRTKILDHGLAFFTILIWGMTFICTKYLTETFSSLEILYIRYLAAYLVLWAFYPKPFGFQGVREELLLLVTALCGAGLYQYLENLAVEHTSAASVSFITAMAPIFTAIFAHLILKEKWSVKLFLGMGVSLLGVFFICFADAGKVETGLLGDVIIFASIWLWAVYSVLVKIIGGKNYNGFAVTRRMFLYSLICMTPFMGWEQAVRKTPFPWDKLIRPESYLNLLFLGILASAVCFRTWNRSVEKLGPVTAGKYLFLSPVVTLLGETVISHTLPGRYSLLGMALILAGLALSEQKKEKSPVKAVIFDMDGTLLDTLDDLTDSVNNALGTFGFPLREKDEIRLFLGNGIKNLVERAVPAGTEEETVRQVLDCFRTHYFAHSADKTKAYDGVLPLLEELKRKGIKTAVVSNKADKAVKELAKTYFGDLLDVAVGENEEAGVRKKPAPDEVFAAMRSLGVRREECLFVGDSEVDAETAAAAGIKGIACLWGFRDRGFLTEKGVSRFIDTPAELYAYLK